MPTYDATIEHDSWQRQLKADPKREKMQEFLGREVRAVAKQFIVVWDASDNTIYEGCHLDSLCRDGDGNIVRFTCKQCNRMKSFELANVKQLMFSDTPADPSPRTHDCYVVANLKAGLYGKS